VTIPKKYADELGVKEGDPLLISIGLGGKTVTIERAEVKPAR
jgi:bifunctional DNA-binding transcriptional regulator/antitoxin component of YhaV-PrlF toxin-antitoxin module